MPFLLGVDLGGTSVKLGICDGRGRVRDSRSIPTRPRRGPKAVVADIAAAARTLEGFESARACGIGAPGPLDLRRTRILVAPNLGWKNVPLPRLLEAQLGRPVRLENDANGAAFAEWAVGAGKGTSSLALYTLGTGVGGGLVLDGRLWTGAAGGAAEFGHVQIDPRGPACACGRRGCLEAFASATAVTRAAGTRSAEEAFESRSPRARKAVESAVAALGAAIAGVFNVLQPERFVISGGMAEAGAGFLERVRRAARERVFGAYRKNLVIVRGLLGNDAGWIGGALLANEGRGRK
ncbi:MAG TPA: ROK family protein [Planctomycetota bacterium]|nr:ROK family protein [Planctomycetota bacterium]